MDLIIASFSGIHTVTKPNVERTLQGSLQTSTDVGVIDKEITPCYFILKKITLIYAKIA